MIVMNLIVIALVLDYLWVLQSILGCQKYQQGFGGIYLQQKFPFEYFNKQSMITIMIQLEKIPFQRRKRQPIERYSCFDREMFSSCSIERETHILLTAISIDVPGVAWLTARFIELNGVPTLPFPPAACISRSIQKGVGW